MPIGALRLLWCFVPYSSRGAQQPLRRWLTALILVTTAAPSLGDIITSAQYTDPTDRYSHGILGDAIEWSGLELTFSDGTRQKLVLPGNHVFEDVAPRLVDVDNDDAPEVMVVETDMSAGAALALYGAYGKITETPHIGTRNRWLAPLGAADVDRDGSVEVAYIDRPHLAKTLRIWRYKEGTLVPVAALPGFTNHRIGERDIAGGIRTCNGDPEMILATANWSRLVAVTWLDETFNVVDLGSDTSRPAFARAMTCSD